MVQSPEAVNYEEAKVRTADLLTNRIVKDKGRHDCEKRSRRVLWIKKRKFVPDGNDG